MANRKKQENANNNRQKSAIKDKQETVFNNKLENVNCQYKGGDFCIMSRHFNIMELLPIVISAVALIVSIYSAYCAAHYSKAEYTYKLDPKIEMYGKIGVQKTSAEPGAFKAGIYEFELSITEKNNLDRAYILYPDNRVEELKLNDAEEILEGKMESSLTAAPDIKIGKYEYKYFFVYLESLDDQGELFLIYTKVFPTSQDEKIFQFNGVSGIEVFGLGNERHENAEEYEGEKIMAEEYARILEELPKYMGQ